MSLNDNGRFDGRNWKYWTQPEMVTVEGRETAYRRKGKGEVVVYLHGGGSTRSWLPFHEALAENFDVIAPEHPGFGDSERGNVSSWDDMVLHYDAFFREIGVQDFHLVAHSLGGWLAANLAVYYPQRFKSISLFTPTGLRLPDAELIDMFRWTEDQALEAMFNGRGDRYVDVLAQGGGVEDKLHAYEESITEAMLAWNPRYDHRLDTRLQRVQAPTLVIGVDDDRVVHTEMSARFAEVIPGARHETLSDPLEPTSHLVHIEKPEAVATLISEHILAHAFEPTPATA